MGRGPKKHMKRIAAPKHWGLDKMGGYWAPRPNGGAHKLRECIPLVLVLRNRLRFALTSREAKKILQERNVLVDGKMKKDKKYPAGFMDVVSIPKIGRHYRLLFDPIGKFQLVKISKRESEFKLVKVTKKTLLKGGYPSISTNDGRVVRFAPPGLKIGDTLKMKVPSQEIVRTIPFKLGALVMAESGRNCGRVGEIIKVEEHDATHDIVYVKDIVGQVWTTRKENIFVIGEGEKSFVSLPKEKGVKLDPVQFREKMMKLYADKRKKKSKDGFSMPVVREKIRRKKLKSKKNQEKKKKAGDKKVEEKKEEKEFCECIKFKYKKKKRTNKKVEKKVEKKQ